MVHYRIRIMLTFVAVAVAIIWFSTLVDRPAPETTAPATDQVVQDYSFSATGVISIVHSDTIGLTEADVHTFLTNDNGDIIELADDVSPIYNGRTVRISGTWVDADPTRTNDHPIVDVQSLHPLESYDASDDAVAGNEQWVNIACRFGDMPDETPQPREYFENIMLNEQPGMDHYWRQTSGGMVDIEGSAAYGWYNLPNDKAYYARVASLNIGIALQMLMRHCTDAAIEQDGVDLKQFGGINVMLNDKFGCCAWGGRMALPIDGENVSFRTTWLPPWAFNSLHVIAHEMGHGWGLPHSSGPYGQTYDSAWDVMSGGTRMMDFCRVGTEAVGCHQVGTIGFHLDMLGWIPEGRVVTVEPGTSATVTLDALTTLRSGTDSLLINVPIDRSRNFYTVEVRAFVAYDRNVPGEAVVLHEVEPGRASPAFVVDADNNGNPNDEGAMWRPGETFEDRSNGIRIEVLGRLGTTFTVRVSNMDS